VLLQLVNSDSRRVIPLIFTQLSLKDLIVSDWSRKASDQSINQSNLVFVKCRLNKVLRGASYE